MVAWTPYPRREGEIMNCRTQVIAAAGIGYVLGRRRKLRWGLMLAAAAAAGRISGPGDILQRGLKAVTSSPDLGGLAGLGAPLVAAGKDAAKAAVTGQIDSVTDRLRDRADLLRRPGGGRQDEDEQADEQADERPDQQDERRRRPATRRDDARPRRRARAASEDQYEEDDDEARDEARDDDDFDEPHEDAPVASRSRPESRPPVRRRGR
jgi:hypothetical protein